MSRHDVAIVHRIMAWIDRHWPCIRPLIPADALPFSRGFGRGDGLCTHPGEVDEFWVHSRGGKRFMLTNPPESFFWVGCQNRGGSEYLFLMWCRAGRKFWFYDQYVVFVSNASASTERTRQRLERALDQWQASTGDVIYSGPWGPLDPATRRFRSDDGKCPEEWDRQLPPGPMDAGLPDWEEH